MARTLDQHHVAELPGGSVTDSAPRVLFIDDEQEVRSAFERVLAGWGFPVDTASGGVEAIRMAQRQDYPIVVTDLRMPGMDGLSLIERLRPAHPDTAFLILSGLPEIDFHRLSLLDNAGIKILSKPWNPQELLHALVRAAELRTGEERGPAGSVLLVEDSPGDALLVERYLRGWLRNGRNMSTCTSLQEAVGMLHEKTSDLILADLSLPDAIGLESVRRLNAAAPEAAIVVLTGMEDDDLGIRALQLGAQDYLVKDRLDAPTLCRALRFALERKRSSHRLAHLAHHDYLTGLANRVFFRQRLHHAVAVASRVQKRFAVAFVDLDHFKPINDTYGHEVGDVLLQEVAYRLSDSVREVDTVARIGGDEFALLLENLDGERQLHAVVERMKRSLGEPALIHGHELRIAASIGVAIYPEAADAPDALLRCADTAMYAAKQRPGTVCRVYTPQSCDGSLPRFQLQNDLRLALGRREFRLAYQPLLDLRTNRIVGLEALLRWFRIDGRACPPHDFIPALEESGLIVDVGRWVLEAAMRKSKELEDQGHVMRMAVNISAVQFEADELGATVREALRRTRACPKRLEIEITESVLMHDTPKVNREFAALKELGIRLSIDDFGTGYSSLAYLTNFQVDALKIDRSFVKELEAGQSGRSVASAIVELGHRLGLEVVAEGVEQADQLAVLRSCGCDIAQGFLIGRPSVGWSAAALEG